MVEKLTIFWEMRKHWNKRVCQLCISWRLKTLEWKFLQIVFARHVCCDKRWENRWQQQIREILKYLDPLFITDILISFGFEYDVLDILIYDIPVFKVGSNPGHVRSEGLLIRDHFLLEKQTLSWIDFRWEPWMGV